MCGATKRECRHIFSIVPHAMCICVLIVSTSMAPLCGGPPSVSERDKYDSSLVVIGHVCCVFLSLTESSWGGIVQQPQHICIDIYSN